jgi:cytochrome c oxidase assembly factor CtaG
MQPVFQAVLRSWSIPPAATFAIVLSALVYVRGSWLLRRAGSPSLPPWRAVTFLLGLFSLWVALASPMDVLNGFVLTAHMLQHMVLMMIAPPLILLGAPLVPMVRGLPVFAAREFAGPFLNWPVAKRVGSALIHPVFALLLMGLAMFAWHTPALYELALRSPAWHQVEHACFLLTSLIFWWPVVQPWPSKTQWPRWAMVPYLLVADLQNTALSAVLVFSDRVLYPSYSAIPRLFGFSAQEDQVAAGAIMWVVGSLAFVVPAIIIAVECLSRKPSQEALSPRRRETSFPTLFPARSEGIPFLARSLPPRWKGERLEVASFVVLFVFAGLCFAGLLGAGSDDDDNQALRFQDTSGPFAVAVFAPPGDFTVGSVVPFSVLVQDLDTHDVLLDTVVDLTAKPAADVQRRPSSMRASYDDSENKLLQTGKLDLQATGDWVVKVALRRNSVGASFSLPLLHVVKADTSFDVPWGYLFVLLVAAILVLVYTRRCWLRSSGPIVHAAVRE